MENAKVSIITPSYNSTAFIRATIDSVKSQSFQNWEMIIVDDCSEDDSVSYIESIIKNDSRIKLIALSNNVGAASARNKAYHDSDAVISNLKNAVEHMISRGMNPAKFAWVPNGCDDYNAGDNFSCILCRPDIG